MIGKTFRFKAASAGTYTITWKDLGDLWCVAATTTSAYQLANTVKIRAIEIWAPMAADLIPVTTSVEWVATNGVGQGNSALKSDTSMGSNSPAHVFARPPKRTLEGFTQFSGSSDSAFRVVLPLNAIIDVHLTLAIREDGTASPVGGAVAGATVGANYVRALNSNTSTTTIPPLSYQTI